MTWNTDISAAPKGRTVTVMRNTKTKDGVVRLPAKEFEPDHLWLATDCGKVIKSYWVPQKLTPNGAVLDNGGRWSGFTRGVDPVAWQTFIVPEHPNVLAKRGAALDELGALDGSLMADGVGGQ